MKTQLTFFAFLFLAICGPAKSGSAQQLTGSVLEEPSGHPISGVEVVLLDAGGNEQTETLSDDQGRFVVELPAPGGFYLLARRFRGWYRASEGA